ncbi:MAG: PilW family protein [Acidiferrobacterales bacterium]
MVRSASIKSPREQGLTLVELMVSLAVASILAIAILGTLGFSFHRNRVSSDAVAMNDDARAALTLISRDVASAGFLFGSAQSQCAVTLTYDSAGSPAYVQMHPIWAQTETAGQTLPLGNVTADYPPAGDTNASGVAQVLLTASAPSAASFIAQTASPLYIVQFGTTQSGNGQGALASTQLPTDTLALNSTQGIQSGDTAYLQVPMNGGTVCMRVPIVKVGAGTGGGATYIDSKPSNYMPSNGYQDFGPQIPASYGTLTNGALLHARILDLGQTPQTLEIVQYWIDDSQNFPVLMRGTYSGLTDAPLSTDALAPGVVSLQVLFATIPQGAPTGTPVTWKSWGDVLAGDQVLEADVALVVRTLHPDPTYTAPTTIVVPQPVPGLTGTDAFVNYVRQPSEVHDHFQVYTASLFLRNLAWE